MAGRLTDGRRLYNAINNKKALYGAFLGNTANYLINYAYFR